MNGIINILGFEPELNDYILHRKKDSNNRVYRILQVININPLKVKLVYDTDGISSSDYPTRITAYKMTGLWEMKKINYLDVVALCI